MIPNMGIDDALFSKTRRRILGLLFGNPERSYYMNEIVRHADAGIGSVQRELGRMAQAGLVVVERQGNQKHFRADPACVIFDELRSIVRKAFDISEIIRTALIPSAREIRQAFLFGPAARGHRDGPVDLLVESDTLGHGEIERVMRHVTAETGRAVVVHLVRSAEMRARTPALKRVLKQPRLPLLGDA